MTNSGSQISTNAAISSVVSDSGTIGSALREGWRDPWALAFMAAMTTFNPTPQTLDRLRLYLPESSTVHQASRPSNMYTAPLLDPIPAGERIRDILRYLGLTKTQLKDACRVSRQTLYDWLGGSFEPGGSNAERLREIHALALVVARIGAPLAARLTQSPLQDGRSFAQHLGDKSLDFVHLSRVAAKLAHDSAIVTERSAKGTLERIGGVAPSEETQRGNLEDNIADFE